MFLRDSRLHPQRRKGIPLLHRRNPAISALWCTLLACLAGNAFPAPPVPAPSVLESTLFESNQGQFPADVLFAARTPNGVLLLTADGHRYVLAPPEGPAAEVRYRLLGAKPAPRMQGREPSPAVLRHYRGNDPAQWRLRVPLYREVEVNSLYPGIRLVHRRGERGLEHDYVVAPRADPGQIRFAIEGASAVELTAAGDLAVKTAAGTLRYGRPAVYQETPTGRVTVAGGYQRRGGAFGFRIGAYDASLPLVIDPLLNETIVEFGGSDDDRGVTARRTPDGKVIVVGTTVSPDFPGTNTEGIRSLTDLFVARVDPDTQELEAATVVGGVLQENVRGLLVDAQNNVYAFLDTNSPDLPQPLGQEPSRYHGGPSDLALMTLDEDLELTGTYYLGGNGVELGAGIDFDPLSDHLLLGFSTDSTDLPVPDDALQTGIAGGTDCAAMLLNRQDLSIADLTLFGGTQDETCREARFRSFGEVVLSGNTVSPDLLPSENAFQPDFGGGMNDGFVAVLNAGLSQALYTSYLGGAQTDLVFTLDIDAQSKLLIGGLTDSLDFPVTTGQMPPAPPIPFVAQLDPDGEAEDKAAYIPGGQVVLSIAAIADAFGIPEGSVASLALPEANGATGTNFTLLDTDLGVVSQEHLINVGLNSTEVQTNRQVLLAGTKTGATAQENQPVVTTAGIPEEAHGPRLTVGKIGYQKAHADSLAQYQIVIANRGSEAAENVRLEDVFTIDGSSSGVEIRGVSIPKHEADCTLAGNRLDCSFGTIPAGGGRTVFLTVFVRRTGRLLNTATVRADNVSDPVERITSTDVSSASADLSVVKRRSKETVTAEDTFEYILTVTNRGPSDASGVVLTDTYDGRLKIVSIQSGLTDCERHATNGEGSPEVICDVGFLAIGETQEIRIAVETPAGSVGYVSNEAEVSASVDDPNISNNFSRNTTTWKVEPQNEPDAADLELYINANLYGVRHVLVNVRNKGPGDALEPHVTLRLPQGVTLQGTPAECNEPTTSGVVRCRLETIPAGADAYIDPGLEINVEPPFVPVEEDIEFPLEFAGNVWSLTPDPNLANNVARQLPFLIFRATDRYAQYFDSLNSASGDRRALVAGSDPALYGANLTDALYVADTTPLPRTLGGVVVRLNDTVAPLFFAAPGQVNFQVPWELTGESEAQLTVYANDQVIGPTRVSLEPFAPGIFTTAQTGSGQGSILIAGTAAIAAPVDTFPGSRPVKHGEFLSIYCNGLGPVDDPPPTGEAAPTDKLVHTTHTVTATVGGVDVPVAFAGLAPGFVGLYQVNLEITDAVPSGDEVPLALTVEGVSSNEVTVAVE